MKYTQPFHFGIQVCQTNRTYFSGIPFLNAHVGFIFLLVKVRFQITLQEMHKGISWSILCYPCWVSCFPTVLEDKKSKIKVPESLVKSLNFKIVHWMLWFFGRKMFYHSPALKKTKREKECTFTHLLYNRINPRDLSSLDWIPPNMVGVSVSTQEC